MMTRFNLIDEPWIKVIDENNQNTMVSIKAIFENANKYKKIAGDMATQDFAVFRVLLSILHTVYSRFDFYGDVYENVHLDEKFKPINELDDEDDIDEYKEALMETWKNLWKNKCFTDSINKYLEKWHDRFYLFDDKYPFFQVSEEDIADKINENSKKNLLKYIEGSNKKDNLVKGKTINRLICESDHKLAMFSPKYDENKSKLSEADIIRWLIMYQGYTGVADKVKLETKKYTTSKGWLYDIGGIYVNGENLFETFMLNLILVHPNLDTKIQKPCWEYENEELIQNYLKNKEIDNLAELYTNWSRVIYINSELNIKKDFKFFSVKLPEINHENNFLECMTLLKYDEKEKVYKPLKHELYKSLWRNYGLITTDKNIGIRRWLDNVKNEIKDFKINIIAISMQADNNSSSRIPINEIYDGFNVENSVFLDKNKKGWIIRINDIVEITKDILDKNYRMFVRDLRKIRNIQKKEEQTELFIINNEVEKIYLAIDTPFKNWLSSLKNEDNIEEKMNEWKCTLKNIIEKYMNAFLENANMKDYKGIEKNGKIENIITIYNRFLSNLLKKCNVVRKEEKIR